METAGTVCLIQEENTFEWEIKDFLNLEYESGQAYTSPTFCFADVSLEIRIFPYGKKSSASVGYVDLLIYRISSLKRHSAVDIKMGFKTADEKNYLIGAQRLNYYFDWFCHTKVILRSDLIKRKSELLPFGALTVICILKRSDRNIVKASATDISKYKVLQDLKKLYLNQADCDVTIRVKGREFPAHQAFLKVRSPVLCSAFQTDMKEKATGVVEIEDCDPFIFAHFLCFLYCGEVENLSVENVFSLFTIADKYEVVDLKSKCLQFMKENLSVGTFCDTISLALLHSEADLIKFSSHFFTKNMPKIIVTVEWQQFLTEYPIVSNELLIKALVPDESSDA